MAAAAVIATDFRKLLLLVVADRLVARSAVLVFRSQPANAVLVVAATEAVATAWAS